ncbi:MAG: hypothetical protein LBJ35_06495 [Spirochaetaceae bacterium]|nr:hypothetical protein [Spirochaetaceae bacterium]
MLIILTAVFWYALLPLIGIFASRHNWHTFRERFAHLCRKPQLNYTLLRQNINGEYHLIGNFESVTGDNTLWIKNDELTAPVSLKNAQTYMMPLTEKKRGTNAGEKIYVDANDFDTNASSLRRLSWNKISALTAGAKVFIGGVLKMVNGQQTFVSSKKHPLLLIFYECSERTLSAGVIRAGRYQTEYWNAITPYSVIGGIFSLIWVAQLFFARPAYRSIVLSAIVAIFGPLFPLLPPGLIFTIFYRQLWWRACLYRVFRDIALLTLRYSEVDEAKDGAAAYGCRVYDGSMAGDSKSAGVKIPRLIPADKPEKNEQWYIAGIMRDGAAVESANQFIPYGLLPGNPKVISRIYNRKAVFLEISAWLVLAAGIALNVFFAELIIYFIH